MGRQTARDREAETRRERERERERNPALPRDIPAEIIGMISGSKSDKGRAGFIRIPPRFLKCEVRSGPYNRIVSRSRRSGKKRGEATVARYYDQRRVLLR